MNASTSHPNTFHRRASDRAMAAFECRADVWQKKSRMSVSTATRTCDHGAFEIRNMGNKSVRGIEIELTDFSDKDTFSAFYRNQTGAPRVIRSATSIRIQFESSCRMRAHALSQSTYARVSGTDNLEAPFIWELAMISGSWCDRFILELSTQNVKASYRWLLAKDGNSEELVVDETLAQSVSKQSKVKRSQKLYAVMNWLRPSYRRNHAA
jgi:hypothetical protein